MQVSGCKMGMAGGGRMIMGVTPAFTWAWCDGNHDGIGENYFFDENGYMSMDQQLRKSL